MNPLMRRFLTAAAILFGFFLSVRYLLPLILPFLIGALLALGAEPIVRFFCRHLRLPRPVASGIGVGMSFAFLAIAVLLLVALVVRELRALTGIVPDLVDSIRGGMLSLSSWLLALAQQAPGGASAILTRSINDFFSDGSALLDQGASWLLHVASGLLSRIPGSALGIGTGIIASFMISAKLPKMQALVEKRLKGEKFQSVLGTLHRLRHALGGWLKAQLKLSLITFCVACVGLLLLRIPYAPLWAVLIALVDAFPVLGTGTVLVPWSLVSFLQGQYLLAFSLLGLYAAAAVTRTVLEPRFVGRQLGIDPLVTLLALYVGFKLFGILGMILSPILAVVTSGLVELTPDNGF